MREVQRRRGELWRSRFKRGGSKPSPKPSMKLPFKKFSEGIVNNRQHNKFKTNPSHIVQLLFRNNKGGRGNKGWQKKTYPGSIRKLSLRKF